MTCKEFSSETESYSIMCVSQILLISSSMNGYLSCFCLLTCCECSTVNTFFKVLASAWGAYSRRWHCSTYNNWLHLLSRHHTLLYVSFYSSTSSSQGFQCFTSLLILILYHCLFFSNDRLCENALCSEVHFPGVIAVRHISIGSCYLNSFGEISVEVITHL